MNNEERLNRRAFLRLSAVTAASTIVAACSGATSQRNPTATPGSQASGTSGSTPAESSTSSTPMQGRQTTPSAPSSVASKPAQAFGVSTPVAAPDKFQESPQLAALVKQGKLPPVEQRLPKNPYVVPHKWLSQGKYGGAMNWVCSDTTDWGTTHFVQESMYGHSPLRWLEDGQAVGPGLAESWESNKDQTVWTFHFRQGLKWSDGKPWTVDDILYWWEDEIGNKDLNPSGTTPSEFNSGSGSPPKLKKVDDVTIEFHYNSPTPLAPEYAAVWVKRGIGPGWMQPKHYLKQFHIKYNPSLNKKKWVDTYNSKADWPTNPDSPTMTGWKLTSRKQGQFSMWERNPYYYCVDRWGNQLPYLNGITLTNFQDPQAMRLQIEQGKADYVHGAFVGVTLGDVSSIKSSSARSKLDVYLWDGGTGAGSAFWFNLDYQDSKYRDLFRNPKFRQALSYAFNRKDVIKAVYFNTGDGPTTGTMSPKAIEFNVAGGRAVYNSWRDSYVEYNPSKAKQMLDELGLKDGDSDGWREFPDGSKLRITLDYTTPGSQEHIGKDEVLQQNWRDVGINAKMNPVSGTGFSTNWNLGKVMSNAAWTASDGPSLLLYSSNFAVQNDPAHWAPLHTQYYLLKDTPEAKKQLNVDPWKRQPARLGPQDKEFWKPVGQIWNLYDKAKTETDPLKRNKLVWEAVKVHIKNGPMFQGTVANTPYVELVKQGLNNLPQRDDLVRHGYVEPWIHPTPAVYDPESWYWEDAARRNAKD